MTGTIGIIGYPLAHSISPAFQQAALDFYGMDRRYVLWETPTEDLAKRITALRDAETLGANVTVPHKEAMLPYMNSLTDAAREVGAINTIVFKNNDLHGHNTDVGGFLRALREDGGFDPTGKHALILGAGGAARAVAYALTRAGLGLLTIANRSEERAWRLIIDLGISTNAQVVPLEAPMRPSATGWDLIVNCTTLGMQHSLGENKSPLAEGSLSQHSLLFDLVYNPEETPFLRTASRLRNRTLGGLPMLIYQGAEAFQLWTGLEAPIGVMFQAARRALEMKGLIS